MLTLDAVRLNVGEVVTVWESSVTEDVPVARPWISRGEVPSGALLLAVNVSVLVPVVDDGLNDAVTPGGSDIAERVTVPVKFPSGTTVTTDVAELPCAMLVG